jgi:hypothetical protein
MHCGEWQAVFPMKSCFPRRWLRLRLKPSNRAGFRPTPPPPDVRMFAAQGQRRAWWRSGSSSAATFGVVRHLKQLAAHRCNLSAVSQAKQKAHARQVRARRRLKTRQFKPTRRLIEWDCFLRVTRLELNNLALLQTSPRIGKPSARRQRRPGQTMSGARQARSGRRPAFLRATRAGELARPALPLRPRSTKGVNSSCRQGGRFVVSPDRRNGKISASVVLLRARGRSG